MTLIEALPLWLQALAGIAIGLVGVGFFIGIFFGLMALNDIEGNS